MPVAVGRSRIPTASPSDPSEALAQRFDISDKTYDKLTPTGARLMKSARWWMGEQSKNSRFPKPKMCAANATKVFRLSGINGYNDEGVRNLVANVGSHGGVVQKMPKKQADFVAKLNGLYGGHLPAGTLVAGESVRDSKPGSQHIGFIGHTDPDGTVWLYQNNWYRPENEGGKRKAYMVSDENLARGFPRQFMATPWIRIHRDGAGQVTRVESLMPAIDDMDPFNPEYGVTLAVPGEIVRELRANPG